MRLTQTDHTYHVVVRADGQTAVTAHLFGDEVAVTGSYATRREACEAVWQVIG